MLLLSGVSVIRRVPNPYLAILAVLLAGSIAGCDREKAGGGQPADGQANISAGQAKGVGQFEYMIDRSHKGEAAPTAAFTGPDDAAVTLSAFRGKPLLVNLWATWCAPCVAEMPTLDALAAKSSEAMAVIAVAQDLQGVDLVVDPVGGATLKASLGSLGYRGRVSLVGNAGREPMMVDVSSLMGGNRRLSGVFLGAEIMTDRVHDLIQTLIEEAARGELQVIIDKTFPLSEAAAAHAYIESRAAVGRVLLIP